MSLHITLDRSLIHSAGRSSCYVLAAIEAPLRTGGQPRLPLNFALVIDRSGSMKGEKIAQAREAAAYVVRQLTRNDRIAVVAYDDQIDVLVPSTPATPEAVAAALHSINELTDRGTTDLSGGWLAGCREIADYLDGEQIARCLLLTDGLANRGITDQAVLCQHAGQLRARGIVTSTFGIGRDFDEVRLSAIAEASGGTFRLIRDAEEIPGLIRQELQEGLEVVAPQAKLEVTAPIGVVVTSLNDFPLQTDATGTTRIHLGDLVSGQTLEPVVRLQFPPGDKGTGADVSFRLSDRDGVLDTHATTATYEYASQSANEAQPRERIVDRRVAATYAARAKREALALNRDGNFRAAEQVIERCLRRIRDYAGDDPELNAIVADLESARARLGRDMDVMHRKSMYSLSVSDVKLRTSSGASQRRVRARSIIIVPCSQATAAAARRAVEAFQAAEVQLVGRLRASESWPEFQAQVPQGPQLSPVQENAIVDAAHARWHEEGLRVVLTPAQLTDNWFSHWHPAGRTAVVSLFRTSDLVGVELAAYLAYELLLNGLNNASPRYDLTRLAHDETRGCLYDFCGDKRDMEIKLQALNVCTPCMQTLSQIGIDTGALAIATDVIRDLARPVRRAAG